MGIRETLNKNPAITTGVTIGIIVVALIIIGWQVMGGGGSGPDSKTFFTTDDSSLDAAAAALFRDDATKIPPFDYKGKPAYRAVVYTFDGGKTKTIGYLERYTPAGQKKIKEYREAITKTQSGPLPSFGMEEIETAEKEIMKPGVTKWGKFSDRRHNEKTTKVDPPAGKSMADMEPMP